MPNSENYFTLCTQVLTPGNSVHQLGTPPPGPRTVVLLMIHFLLVLLPTNLLHVRQPIPLPTMTHTLRMGSRTILRLASHATLGLLTMPLPRLPRLRLQLQTVMPTTHLPLQRRRPRLMVVRWRLRIAASQRRRVGAVETLKGLVTRKGRQVLRWYVSLHKILFSCGEIKQLSSVLSIQHCTLCAMRCLNAATKAS